MTTTTQITSIGDRLDLTDYAGDFLGDFDMDDVAEDFRTEIQARLPEGVTLLGNGDIIAELDVAEQARDIDWDTLLDDIDVSTIFERHDRRAKG